MYICTDRSGSDGSASIPTSVIREQAWPQPAPATTAIFPLMGPHQVPFICTETMLERPQPEEATWERVKEQLLCLKWFSMQRGLGQS